MEPADLTEKPKPKIKPGRVVRLTPDLVKLVAENQTEGESIPSVIRRLLGIVGDIHYVLPSDLHDYVADARGIAIIRAIRSKKPERPLAVRTVIK